MVSFFKRRQDIIATVILIGVDPYVGDSLFDILQEYDGKELTEKLFDIIKRIKTCYYLSFINNMLVFDKNE